MKLGVSRIAYCVRQDRRGPFDAELEFPSVIKVGIVGHPKCFALDDTQEARERSVVIQELWRGAGPALLLASNEVAHGEGHRHVGERPEIPKSAVGPTKTATLMPRRREAGHQAGDALARNTPGTIRPRAREHPYVCVLWTVSKHRCTSRSSRRHRRTRAMLHDPRPSTKPFLFDATRNWRAATAVGASCSSRQHLVIDRLKEFVLRPLWPVEHAPQD